MQVGCSRASNVGRLDILFDMFVNHLEDVFGLSQWEWVQCQVRFCLLLRMGSCLACSLCMGSIKEEDRGLARRAKMYNGSRLALWGNQEDRMSQAHEAQPCEEKFRGTVAEKSYGRRSGGRLQEGGQPQSESVGATVDIGKGKYLVGPTGEVCFGDGKADCG